MASLQAVRAVDDDEAPLRQAVALLNEAIVVLDGQRQNLAAAYVDMALHLIGPGAGAPQPRSPSRSASPT